MQLLIIAICLGVGAFIGKRLWDRYEANKPIKMDYSYGQPEPKAARAAIERGDYREAESIILSVDWYLREITIFYLVLMLDEALLQRWQNQSQQKDIPNTVLAFFYDRKGWEIRSYARAKNVSAEQFQDFHHFQRIARDIALEIPEGSPMEESAAMLLLTNRTIEDLQAGKKYYFNRIMELNPQNATAYISLTLGALPKWDDMPEVLENLIENPPEDPLIRNIIQALLIHESFLFNTNHFGGTETDLRELASTTFRRIDLEIDRQPISSLLRYRLFGYMFYIAQWLGNQEMQEKYGEKISDYLPPKIFGVQQPV